MTDENEQGNGGQSNAGTTSNADSQAQIDAAAAAKTGPPKPNIILSRAARPITVDGPINMGLNHTINLPSLKDQEAGWYEPEASLLLTQYAGIYKVPGELGRPAHVFGGQGPANQGQEGGQQ